MFFERAKKFTDHPLTPEQQQSRENFRADEKSRYYDAGVDINRRAALTEQVYDFTIDFYRDLKVQIDRGQLPEVYIMTPFEFYRLFPRNLTTMRKSYHPRGHFCIVTDEEEHKYYLGGEVAHEVFHGTGPHKFKLEMVGEKGFIPLQLGYEIYTSHDPSTSYGDGLEEITAVLYQRRFSNGDVHPDAADEYMVAQEIGRQITTMGGNIEDLMYLGRLFEKRKAELVKKISRYLSKDAGNELVRLNMTIDELNNFFNKYFS